jgi:hypothetical protein
MRIEKNVTLFTANYPGYQAGILVLRALSLHSNISSRPYPKLSHLAKTYFKSSRTTVKKEKDARCAAKKVRLLWFWNGEIR